MPRRNGPRSVLRQDSDIIMLGEIRDHETAVMAIQSSLTGHMVFSTLHPNDAPSAVTGLLDLGIEPYLASSPLLAVLAQRLVRQICRSCRIEIQITDAERKSLLLGNPLTSAYTRAGCDACRGTGYSGRFSISKLLLVTEAIQPCIQQQDNAAQIRNAATANGFEPMRTDGIRKIAEGGTTAEEVLRVSAS